MTPPDLLSPIRRSLAVLLPLCMLEYSHASICKEDTKDSLLLCGPVLPPSLLSEPIIDIDVQNGPYHSQEIRFIDRRRAEDYEPVPVGSVSKNPGRRLFSFYLLSYLLLTDLCSETDISRFTSHTADDMDAFSGTRRSACHYI